MQKLIFDIDEELSVIEKYQITPSELFLVRLILLAQESDEEKEYLRRYLSIPNFGGNNFRNILLSLQDKGILLKII